MEICSFISKHKYFSQIYPMTITAVSVTTQNTTSSWMTLCIDVVSTLFSGDALPTRKLNKFWMIATLEHVAVIYLGWLQPNFSFALGYFWPYVFKDCHEAIKNFPPCQHFYPKKRTHPSPLHPIIAVGPFTKWGIDFMHYKPTSARGMVTSS